MNIYNISLQFKYLYIFWLFDGKKIWFFVKIFFYFQYYLSVLIMFLDD